MRFFFAPLAAADTPASHTFDAKGVKLHYLEAGKGDPVILIHGLHASAEINWNLPGIVAELAKTNRVIALDLPGHGQSEKPKDDAAYGKQLVEDVVLLLDHLKIKKAPIVGYSLGGMVALKLLAVHPDRVSKCLVGGMGWMKEGSPLQNMWDIVPTREDARTPSEFIKSIGQLALTEEELKKIAVPVRVLIGERDPIKRLYVVPLQAVHKDWPVVEIAGTGHLLCVLKPQFREELVAWLAAK